MEIHALITMMLNQINAVTTTLRNSLPRNFVALVLILLKKMLLKKLQQKMLPQLMTAPVSMMTL